MLDDFFTRALITGIGVALVAGPLGCFIVWRRLAYFGDSLSHAALLGVAFGLLADINLTLSVLVVCIAVSAILLLLQSRSNISSDALLGIFSHGALSLGLVALALTSWIRIDVMGLLFGDILAVSKTDILFTYVGGAVILGILILIWRPLFAATVNRELAEAEGMKPAQTNIIFTLLTAAVIALSIKIVGVLLITALLIIPAATARRIASTPETMAILASLVGVLSVISGLYGSLQWDTPSGPSIVVACVLLFAISQSPLGKLFSATKGHSGKETP
ncbi:MAG: metal ABC transporter permease [Rhizobiaceae bacterium]